MRQTPRDAVSGGNHVETSLSAARELTTVGSTQRPPALTTTSAVRKPSYKTTVVELPAPELTQIEMPLYYPRDSNSAHVQQLKGSLLHEGIDDEGGFIAFCGYFGTRQVLRGAQVLQAFTQLYQQGRISYVPPPPNGFATMEERQTHRSRLGYKNGVLHVGTIRCVQLQRVDENTGVVSETPFTATESLLLAAHYNGKNGRIRPMTMIDSITLAQRFILCRLRDMHLSEYVQPSQKGAVPPSIVWSRLPQFVSEATACSLIPFSNMPSTLPDMDFGRTSTTDDQFLKQNQRSLRQRQQEYIRLAMSLLWSPNTQKLLTNRYTLEGKPLTCSLWSIRTFRLRPFTSADDALQFIMLIAMYRYQHDRRKMKIRQLDRMKVKTFLDLIESCVGNSMSWAMNRAGEPFPSKWDVFNTETCINVRGHVEPQRVSIATILMSLLIFWSPPKSNSAVHDPNTCSSEDVLCNLKNFMQGWPFEQNWRASSASQPCFEPEIFLKPVLPLGSVRPYIVPGATTVEQTVPLPPAAGQPVIVGQADSRSIAGTAIFPPAPILPVSGGDNVANLTRAPATAVKLLPRPSPQGAEAQTTSVHDEDRFSPSKMSIVSSGTPRPPLNNMEADVVDEVMLDCGQGGSILAVSDDEGGSDTDGDVDNSTDSDPVNGKDMCAQQMPVKGSQRPSVSLKLTRNEISKEAVQQRHRGIASKRKKGRRKKPKARPITDSVPRSPTNIVSTEKQGVVDKGDESSDEECLEALYDKISAELPAPTDVQNLPTACHDKGA